MIERRDLKGLIPREHGSWAYVIGPQIAALLASPDLGPAALWATGSLLLFFAFQGFAAAARRKARFSRAGCACALAGGACTALAARANPWAALCLAPAAVPALTGLLVTRGRLGRDDAIEVSGIAASSILGAGGLLSGGGAYSHAALLALASFAYFVLSLISVRMRLAAALPGRRPLFAHGWNLIASLLLLAASAAGGILLRGLIAGFLPGIYVLRTLVPLPRRSDGRPNVTRLGIQEAVTALLFCVGLGLYLPN